MADKKTCIAGLAIGKANELLKNSSNPEEILIVKIIDYIFTELKHNFGDNISKREYHELILKLTSNIILNTLDIFINEGCEETFIKAHMIMLTELVEIGFKSLKSRNDSSMH